jgi:hypothetical protein
MPAPIITPSRSALLAAAVVAVGTTFLVGGKSHPALARHLPPPPALAAAPTPAPSPTYVIPPPPPNADPPRFTERLDVSTFQKGNIHTHTTWSDGDRPPQDVYKWYRDHGYAFLAITDHNNLTDPAIFRLLEKKNKFIMITGEEVTMWGHGKQVHVNALCHKRTIGGKKRDTQGEVLAWGVAKVKEQGGVALVNHPNWDWALSASDLGSARGAALLEIWSGHPHVHTLGDGARPSHETLWDIMLTQGEGFAAAAVDDAHSYGARAPDNAPRPGRAWVFTYAPELSRKAICEALGKGRLYASTGVTLQRIAIGEDTYAVYPADRSAEVEFVGWGGVVLQSGKAGDDGAARYKLKGGEGYVRARLRVGDKRAWTQAVRLSR